MGYVAGSTTCLSDYSSQSDGVSCYKDSNKLKTLSGLGIYASTSMMTPISYTNSVMLSTFTSN